MLRTSALLAASTGAVGATSYACSLLLARLLPVGAYTDFSASQALLTTVGITASALVPLPLARVVRAYPSSSTQRRTGMAFAMLVSLLIGIVAGGILTAVVNLFASPAVAIVVGACGFGLFAIMPVWGWLQGESRFGGYAALSLLEVSLRLVFSVVAAVVGWGAGGALGGYLAGAGLVVVFGVPLLRRDMAWQPRALADRGRWLETGGIALVQLIMSSLISADVVLIAIVATASPTVAGYQAVATLAKGPVYVAAGTVLVSFPALRTASAEHTTAIVRSAVQSFAWLAFPAAAVLATVPPALALRVLPARYAASLPLLPWLAVAGLGLGVVSVISVILLALRAYRRSFLAVSCSALFVLSGMAMGWATSGTHGLAIGAAAGALGATISVVIIAVPYLPSGMAAAALRAGVLGGVLVTVLLFARPYPWIWLAAVVVAGVFVLGRGRRRPAAGRPVGPLAPGRLRVTHLGFEDPNMPGAGGGSLRTHEINRRLAADGHDITVLVTRFPHCVDRLQDGVRYVHIGFGSGATRVTRLVGYVLALPGKVRPCSTDLVVEDFFAPLSTLAAPLWTKHRTIGMVQWLNARDKTRQYHLPFHLVERFGVRHHQHLIAVSSGVAQQLTALNPRADVEVIGNGVEAAAFTVTGVRGQDVVFVGRLEIAQKGLDLLLRAWALATPRIAGQLVVAGRGPDEGRVRELAVTLGIAARVRFVGWVSGLEKYQLLANARLTVVPSRFETFGIVAVESLAAGTPVVAFDIPCLRDVVPADCGRLVSPFNVEAYADTLVDVYHDAVWLARAGARGRDVAVGYDWGRLARLQAAFYRRVASGDELPAQPPIERSPKTSRSICGSTPR